MRQRAASKKQNLVALVLVAGLAAWIITSRDPWESWSRDRFWKMDRAFADPAALYVDGAVHIYTTSAKQCVPGSCPTYWVPHFTSPALDEPGTVRGDAMPDRPAWVAVDNRAVWAPSVAQLGRSYVMYFAASAEQPSSADLKCLGVALSPTPDGPFAPLPQPLRCSAGYWNLDPYVVTEGSNWFLLWREDDAAHVTGKIVAAPLTPDGLALAAPPRVLLVGEFAWEEGYPEPTSTRSPGDAATDREQPDDVLHSPTGIGPIENPAMARHPVSGQWLLTWSANRWETPDYATGLATCQGPLGPCERQSRDAPWLHEASDPAFTTSADFRGCGGLSFVTGPDERLYAVLHAYRGSGDWPDPPPPRVGWVYAVEFDGDYGLTEFS